MPGPGLDLDLPSRKLTRYTPPPPPFCVTLTPHPFPTHDFFPSSYSKTAPPFCLQTCHPFSKASLKGTSPRKPSRIVPAHVPLFLPVLNSPALDYTGWLGSFPNCFMVMTVTITTSFCLLSAYCVPSVVLKTILSGNPNNCRREVGKLKFREVKSLVQDDRAGAGELGFKPRSCQTQSSGSLSSFCFCSLQLD